MISDNTVCFIMFLALENASDANDIKKFIRI